MWQIFGATIAVVLVGFVVYVATRPAEFRYERSGVIMAAPEKIYPYISDFQLGQQWNPYSQKDPNMKQTFSGTMGQVGSRNAFEGNNQVGAGELEVVKVTPPTEVDIVLHMIKPFKADNLIQYRLTPESGGTRFTWTMSGHGGFLSKLMGVLIDCNKMIGGDLEKGISNLKTVVEQAKP